MPGDRIRASEADRHSPRGLEELGLELDRGEPLPRGIQERLLEARKEAVGGNGGYGFYGYGATSSVANRSASATTQVPIAK